MKHLMIPLMLLVVSCGSDAPETQDALDQVYSSKSMKQIINSQEAPAPIGPYSQAVLKDGTLYVSGQIALDPVTNQLDTGSIEAETERVLKNLGAVLNEAGMDYTDVVKCSIFLSDMSLFGEVNEIYGKYFSQNPPARETVAVKTLPKEVNVEISCIAVQ